VTRGSGSDGKEVHPRCPYAVEACREETPALAEVAPGHLVACHRARELTLRGVAVPLG